ncbi:MAG: ABC transporter substrate-binding protein [Chloroflexi bacterium]|nr:ABC transporter substrate-binding protein [Chloroflexota bacterium]
MRRKIVWLLVSGIMVAALVLAACAQAPTAPTTPTTPTAPATPATPTTPTTPATTTPTTPAAAGPETVKVTLKKLDGTTVERTFEKPKYGGTITMVRASDPRSFDPSMDHEGVTWTARWTNQELTSGDLIRGPQGTDEATYDYLRVPRPANVRGYIAETWEMPDANTLIYHIRKGIYFHNKPPTNGRELNANDIVFSFMRNWKETKTSWHYQSYPWDQHFESMEAPDKWTVVIKSKPGKLPIIWENGGDHINVVAPEAVQKYGDLKDWRNSIGTGPFMLTDYVSGGSVTFAKNQNYWQKHPFFPEDSLPYIDTFKILIIPDIATRLTAMRTGKVDMFANVPLGWDDAKALIQTNPELKYREYLSGSTTGITFRVDRPELPTYDIRVRRALNMAVDLNAVLQGWYAGKAVLVASYAAPLPDLMGVYTKLEDLPDETRELFTYDPEKAKKLLTEAGYPSGFKAEVLLSSVPASNADMVSMVKDFWSKIGVDLTLNIKEPAVYTGALYGRQYEMAIGGVSNSSPYNLWQDHPLMQSNSNRNNDPRILQDADAMYEAYFDLAEKDRIMRELGIYILGQAYRVMFPMPYSYEFWQPWLKGYGGEQDLGYDHNSLMPMYAWVDQDLKQKLTGRR